MSDQLENESYFRSRFVSQPMLEEIQESSSQGLSFIKWKKKATENAHEAGSVLRKSGDILFICSV